MDERKRKRLEKAGWTVGSAREFVGLSAEDEFLMELQLDLGEAIRELRTKRGITQAELGVLLATRPSHVSEMEAGQGSTSRMIRALAVLGVDRAALARILRSERHRGAYRVGEIGTLRPRRARRR